MAGGEEIADPERSPEADRPTGRPDGMGFAQAGRLSGREAGRVRRGEGLAETSFEPDPVSLTRGEIAAEISTRIVQLVKEHADRGPTKCRTYIDDDHVMVLMRGGFSRLENTLFQDGKWLDVRSTRHAFQDTMEGRFTEVIESHTGRQVVAFMSASHQRPDLQMEVFILDGGPDPSSADPTP